MELKRESHCSAKVAFALLSTVALWGCSAGDAAGLGGETGTGGTGVLFESADPLDSTGPAGGPFSPASGVYSLTNNTEENRTWQIAASEDWLVFSPDSGTLAPDEEASITATIVAGATQALSPGSYDNVITVTETGTGKILTALATLNVTGSGGSLSQLTVTPEDGLFAYGEEGGAFPTITKTFTVTNTGNVPTAWSASATQAWIFLNSSTSGTLDPGNSTTVEVELDSWTAQTFSVGTHDGSVRIQNDDDSSVTERPVEVVVSPPSSSVGWTEFTPSADTRIIYVSQSEGSDSNNGLSKTTPVKTIQVGLNKLRDGFPDWLLLKRGDVWTSTIKWNKSGRSLTERAILGSYGEPGGPRPKLQTGGKTGIFVAYGPSWSTPCNYVAFVDIEVDAAPRPPGSNPVGIEVRNPNLGLLIEGCYVHGFKNNINIDEINAGISRGAVLRRNLIANAMPYKDGSFPHSQGMYVNGADDFLLEENIFVKNGWSETDPLSGPPTVFNHNVYITDGSGDMTVRGNLILEGAGSGLQQRPGGVCEENFFAHSADNLALGSGNRPDMNPFGVVAICRNNVFLHGRNVDTDKDRALVLNNIQSGIVSGNIFGEARKPDQNGAAIMFNTSTDSVSGNMYGIQSCTIENNKFTGDHGSAILVKPSFSAAQAPFEGVVIRNNVIQDHNTVNPDKPLMNHRTEYTLTGIAEYKNNTMFSSVKDLDEWCEGGDGKISHAEYKSLVGGDSTSKNQQVDWVDPDRDIDTYMGSLGYPATYEAFKGELLKQRRGFWRDEFTASALNAYIRAGFELAP